jgi:hypothetical protein
MGEGRALSGDGNADGGIDGGDVETFIRVWQAGDC